MTTKKTSTRKLGFVDAFFLRSETRISPQHMAGLLIFDKNKKMGDAYLGNLYREMREYPVTKPPFNEKLTSSLFHKIKPTFEQLGEDEIDLDYHFRHSALPNPGGELELGILVSRLYSQPLDLTRPLWEIHLIEGLENNRFAIFCKIHHSLADGTEGMKILFEWLKPDTSTSDNIPLWHKQEQNLAPVKRSSKSLGKSLKKSYAALSNLGSDAVRTTELLLDKDTKIKLPFSAPRTLLNKKITRTRRLATQDIDFNRIQHLSKELGVTINDTILGVIGDALTEYLSEVSVLPKNTLLALNLVNLRKDKEKNSKGNVIGFILADLATDTDNPLERIARIKASTESGKSFLKSLSPLTAGLMSAAPLVQEKLALTTGTEKLLNPTQNVMISNLPGIRKPYYFDGCKLNSLYLPSVLDHGNSLLITVVTYIDKLCFTIVACPDTAPRPQSIALKLSNSVATLERAVKKQPLNQA